MSEKLGVAIIFLGSNINAVALRHEIGAFSPGAADSAPVKEVAPLAPEILSAVGIENAPGTLRITLSLPEANTDGSVLKEAELRRIRIHYGTSSGIDEDDPYNDFPVSPDLTWAPGLSGRVYMRAKVQDSHGNWSGLSNEVYADVPEVEEFDFWAHRVGAESIFTNNSPSAGYVAWSNVTLYFKNLSYTIANGNTNKRYIYWDHDYPTSFQTSDTVPTLDIEDVLIGTNINGTWYLAIYHPQVSAEFIRVGALQSRNWGASEGSYFDLDDGTFKLGGSSAPKLQWDGTNLLIGSGQLGGSNVLTLSSSGLNVGSSGSIRGGQTAWNTGSGFWLGYADGAYKFSVGSSSGNRLTWDGSTLFLTGTLIAPVIKTAESGWRVEISGTGSYPLRYWNGTTTRFYVDISGNVYVSGSIITSGSASNLNADYILSGSLVGRPVYGAGAYPYAALVSNVLSAYQASSYRTNIYPTDFSQLGAQGEVYFSQRYLWVNSLGGDPVIGGAGGNFRLIAGTTGYYLQLEATNADIVAVLNSGYAFRPSNVGCWLGTPSYYWQDIYYKNLVDVGCLGSFDEGVEIEEAGQTVRVSALKALKRIKESPSREKTPYGKIRLDYASFPRACFRPAPVAERDFTEPDGRVRKKGEKLGEDGVELSSLVSIIIAALKELDARLERLEGRHEG